MHTPILVKIHWCLLKLSSWKRNTYGWKDVQTDVRRKTIISRQYRMAGYKKYITWSYVMSRENKPSIQFYVNKKDPGVSKSVIITV